MSGKNFFYYLYMEIGSNHLCFRALGSYLKLVDVLSMFACSKSKNVDLHDIETVIMPTQWSALVVGFTLIVDSFILMITVYFHLICLGELHGIFLGRTVVCHLSCTPECLYNNLLCIWDTILSFFSFM